MRDLLSVTKALSDSHRVRILLALAGGELCGCQVVALIALAPSTVSKHLSVLQQARLVETRKEGKWVYYRLSQNAEASPLVTEAIEWLRRSLAKDPTIRQDQVLLKQILRLPPEALCRGEICRVDESTTRAHSVPDKRPRKRESIYGPVGTRLSTRG